MEVPECNGMCCSSFSMEKYDLIVAMPEKFEDGQQIKDMLIHIGTVDGYKYFTCNNWDRETRKCMIYSSRPRACRDYPQYEPRGCQWCGSNSQRGTAQ